MPSTNTRAEEAPRSIAPVRVLLVDDDEAVCEAMELTLRRIGLEVASVGAALDALDRARAPGFDFDVIVTDMTMPVMGGLELCEQVHALRPDVPILVLSGYATVEAADSARRAGAHGYLVKPVGAEALVLAIEAAVRDRRGA